jgi:hypothetical protein
VGTRDTGPYIYICPSLTWLRYGDFYPKSLPGALLASQDGQVHSQL